MQLVRTLRLEARWSRLSSPSATRAPSNLHNGIKTATASPTGLPAKRSTAMIADSRPPTTPTPTLRTGRSIPVGYVTAGAGARDEVSDASRDESPQCVDHEHGDDCDRVDAP